MNRLHVYIFIACLIGFAIFEAILYPFGFSVCATVTSITLGTLGIFVGSKNLPTWFGYLVACTAASVTAIVIYFFGYGVPEASMGGLALTTVPFFMGMEASPWIRSSLWDLLRTIFRKIA